MDIENVALSRLHNEEHFKLQTEFKLLIELYSPSVLDIETMYYNSFLPYYKNEQDLLNIIRKSNYTYDISEVDALRYTALSGLEGTVKARCCHFKVNVKAAAGRLQVLFKNYRSIVAKSYDEETAAIIKLVAQLQGSYAGDVAILNIADWVAELEAQNIAFDTLKKTRFTVDSMKIQLQMKHVRMQVDISYRAIIKRINALIEINGRVAYIDFVKEFNLNIMQYNNKIAQRKQEIGRMHMQPIQSLKEYK
jgi:hypothetical protein